VITERVRIIVNPAAGRGRGAKLLPAVEEAFGRAGIRDIVRTTFSGEEEALTDRAIADGCTTIVAVGGDGTWGRVAHAIMASGVDVRLAMIAAGTGNDFAKTVGAPATDLAATLALVVDKTARRVDMGQVDNRYFLNTSGFGFDVSVLRATREIELLRGNIVYVLTALRQLFAFRGFDVRISRPFTRGVAPQLMVVIANGRHFGGVFLIAPDASPTDGKLDCILFGPASPIRRLKLFAAATKGRHIELAEVEVHREPRMTFEFAEPPYYETDGEIFRARTGTLDYRCIPNGLAIVAP
jgi:diacylglycerol kinase (ATP)